MSNNPHENKKVIASKSTDAQGKQNMSVVAHTYSAPLPPPDMMAAYEQVVSGSADRIIRRFEVQSDHRQKCERIFMWTQSIKSIGGLVCGFIIAMTAIGGGIYTAIQGRPLLGGSLSFAGLAILVGAFLAEKIFVKHEVKSTEINQVDSEE